MKQTENHETTRQQWLSEGYRQFAESGPENLSIKKISHALHHSRASFYHHFGNKDLFIDELLTMHWHIAGQFNTVGRARCKKLYPDLYTLLGEYTLPLQFTLQLFHHRHIPRYNILFQKIYASSAHAFALKLFAEHLELDPSAQSVSELWVTMGESWYSRLDPNDLSAETLQKHSREIIHTISDLIKSQLYANLHKRN